MRLWIALVEKCEESSSGEIVVLQGIISNTVCFTGEVRDDMAVALLALVFAGFAAKVGASCVH